MLATAVFAGLCWDMGSTAGMIFSLVARPSCLALLSVALWRTSPWRSSIRALLVSVVLTEAISVATYAHHTDLRYVTSDGETQLWIAMSLTAQIIVATTAFILGQGLNRLANQRLQRTTRSASPLSRDVGCRNKGRTQE